MIQGKTLAIAIIFCTAFFVSNVFAFDKSFHPNHQFVDKESIGPNFKTGFVIDKEKAAKTKTSEEEMQLPSGIVSSDPSPKNSNIPTGSARRLIPSL
ncbi:MAG: hypothetical protein HRU78_10825 [Gammaproteobacteria bacterium]|nr:MAG: hypothetical protein HRU78_10825 [Gammaproteobacteria bacterium]